MQQRRILQLCASLSVGGAERLILGLAQHLDRQRFDVHVCGLSVLRGNALQPAFERMGVPVYVPGAERFYDINTIRAVAQYVRAHNIEVIHTHLTHADVVGRIVGMITRRPVVSTMHNEPRDYDQQRRDRRLLQRLTARFLTTRLVAVSPGIREMYIREWGIAPDKITTIRNAVPMDEFLALAETPQHAAGAGVVITNIGRLNPQKAQRLLLDAAKLVLQQRPDARFMIVGQGRLEQELKAHARALGIAGQVIFTGVRHDIPAILAGTDIFVLSSLWEGLPVTAVEAMAAARPVVLTDVGGNRDLVAHGTHGFVVPPGDVAALADHLLLLMKHDRLRQAMGRAAREQVRTAFSMQAFVRQHEALYATLCGEPASADESMGHAAEAALD
jgi:glycosyltransferase involved in cell wall biosynthesis